MASPTIRVTTERFRAVGTPHIVQGDRRHEREDTKGLLRGTWQLRLFALLFTRMLPTVVLIPAFFLMLRALGLQNTLTGLVVAYCSFTLPFTVWIMKAYFETALSS